MNSKGFLVCYRENKEFQCITCPELMKGPLMKVHTDYIKLCHVVSNKCLALTTNGNKREVHILLIKDDKADIIERISLGHYSVTIAATPINFVVVDGNENKMVFYSTCGEELFQKYHPFYGYSHHIYSDNVYFYVLFRRHSILRCYDVYGELKWQWGLPFPGHPHIAVFQGTLYFPDTQLSRVLLYKYQDRSSGCCLPTKNPYIRNLNLRLKEKENDQKLVIGEICNLANGQLVVSDIKHEQQQPPPLDICRWTDDCFIVAFGREMRIFNRDRCRLKTIRTEKYYNRIYKYNDDQLVCGGHYIRDITQEVRDEKYRRWENNKYYYYCIDPIFDPYYVGVVDIKDGKCKDEVCRGKMRRWGRLEGDEGVDGLGVTSFGDVVMRREMKKIMEVEIGIWEVSCFVEWLREMSLVRKIRIGERMFSFLEYYTPRPHLSIIGECIS
ncbi:Hypothetical predicted protein [Octopus vulgaris]|uniref:Uncharacterized protein n=1 Tax=Octopus vulgaris TaxID=6645 RepID=A0AA36APU5_OCTVU|nr:Hypothetical predicted protein [Octopus vulgaris]